MQPLISIIVPVYNVEKYINKCMDSIINQSLKDIEIIMIDDGSTDRCPEILDKYALEDNRIKVIHQKNAGQGAARNKGIDAAKGQFVCFVDADDWIEHNFCELMFNNLQKNNADIIICGRIINYEDSNNRYFIKLDNKITQFIDNDFEEYIKSGNFFDNTLVVTNKIYKLEMIKAINLKFKDVNEIGSEDTIFNYQILTVTSKIVTIEQCLYNTLARNGSTMRTYRPGYMMRIANLVEYLDKWSMQNNYNLYMRCIPYIVIHFIQRNYQIISNYSDSKIIDFSNELKAACKINEFKKVIKWMVYKDYWYEGLKKRNFKITGILVFKIFSVFTLMGLYRLSAKILNN